MSRDDSRGQLLPGSDLKKLMRSPTIEGFVARRSKFNKSVSFQRQTLNSPPFQSSADDGLRRRGSSSEETRGFMVRQASLQTNHMDGNLGRPLITIQRAGLNVGDYKEGISPEGMNKLLTRLSSIGVDTGEAAHTETLVHGVRKILQDKMVS